MAQSKTQGDATRAARSKAAVSRSGDGPVDLADCRRGTVRQAARDADERSGSESGAEARMAGLRLHASARNAVSRHSAQQECRQVWNLAERRAALGPLCNAAFRTHIIQGLGCREKRDHRAIEQRPNGRTEQLPQNPQTGNVWSRRPRTAVRANVACVDNIATEIEDEPIKWIFSSVMIADFVIEFSKNAFSRQNGSRQPEERLS